MTGLELLLACAPTVHPTTVQQVIAVESQGKALALNVNGARLTRQPRDATEAAALARRYMQAGYSVDLGLMQINSTNLRPLGYSVTDMFDPCKNLQAGATVLTRFYQRARTHYPSDEQAALRAALSAYNTGSLTAGFANGYVARYFRRDVRLSHIPAPKEKNGRAGRSRPDPYTADTLVYVRNKEAATMKETTHPVISSNEADSATPGVQVEHSAEQAARNGAFHESALSEADAWESNADLAAYAQDTAIVMHGKRVGSKD